MWRKKKKKRNLKSLEENLGLKTVPTKLGKEYVKAMYCHPAYLTYMQSISCKMPGWMNHKLELRLPGEISTTWDVQWWQNVKGTKEPLDESERGEWKRWLKTQHSKHQDHGIWSYNFMANRWGKSGQWQILFSWAKSTVDIITAVTKLRCLVLGRKAMINLDSVLKIRDITLLTKAHVVKAMIFPVVIYRCENWTIKKVEHRIIYAFELWCWRRLLRVPWTTRRSSQSILKEISLDIHWKDWCWSWHSNTLATWCKELTHLKRPWCWERLRAGGEGMTEHKMVGWHHQLNGHEFEWALGIGDEQGGLACCSPWGHKELDMTGQLIKYKKIIF